MFVRHTSLQWRKAKQASKQRESDAFIFVLDLLRFRIVFGPETNELIEMMRPENRPIPREIIEIVHDDSNEQIDDLLE